MSRPLLLDLFCGAGGAAMGYHRAGFDVVGVDHKPQPNYPFRFIQAEWYMVALEQYLEFDVIHASPPCQAYSTTASLHDNEHPDLIEPTRDALRKTGLPYIIENVVGAPLLRQPTFEIEAYRVSVCGSSFGLGVRRHRLFESNVPLTPRVCAHHLQPEPIDVTGMGGPGGRHRKPKNLGHAREVMGIDWMSRAELSQAVPPAYTEFLGKQILAVLEAVA